MGHINSKLKVKIKEKLQKLQNVLTTEDTDKINKFLEDIEKSNLFSKIARVEIISNSGTFEGVPLFEDIYQKDLEDVQLLGQFYTQFVAAYHKTKRSYKTSINDTLNDFKKRFEYCMTNVNQVSSPSTSSSSSTSHSSSKSSKEEKKDDKPKNDEIGPIVSSRQEAMVIMSDILKKYKLTKPDKTTLKKLLNNYPGIGNEIYFEQGNALALIICKGVTSLVQFWIEHGYTQPVFVDYLKSDYLKGLKQIKSEVASSLKKIQWLASSSSSSTSQDEEKQKNSRDANSKEKAIAFIKQSLTMDKLDDKTRQQLSDIIKMHPDIGDAEINDQGNVLALAICHGKTELTQFLLSQGLTQPELGEELEREYKQGLAKLDATTASKIKTAKWLVDNTVYNEISNDIFPKIRKPRLSFARSVKQILPSYRNNKLGLPVSYYVGDDKTTGFCNVYLMSLENNELTDKNKKILEQNKQKNSPTLIKKKNNQFIIYGDKYGNKEWCLTTIGPKEVKYYEELLKKLPFNEAIIKRDNDLFDNDLVNLLKQGHAAIATINSQYSFKDRNVLSEGDIDKAMATNHIAENKNLSVSVNDTNKLSRELYQYMDEMIHLVDSNSDDTIVNSSNYDSKCFTLYNKIEFALSELTKQIPIDNRRKHVITMIDDAFQAAKKYRFGKVIFKLTDKDNQNNTHKITESNYSDWIPFYQAFRLQLDIRDVFDFLKSRKLIDRLNNQISQAKKITHNEFDEDRVNEDYSVLFDLIKKTIAELEEKMPLVKQQQYGIDKSILAFNSAKTTYTIKKIFEGKSGTKEISMIGDYEGFFNTFVNALKNKTLNSNNQPHESKSTRENKKEQKKDKMLTKLTTVSKKRKQATRDDSGENASKPPNITFNYLQLSDRSSSKRLASARIKQILSLENESDVDEQSKKRRRIDESTSTSSFSSSSSSSVSTLRPKKQQQIKILGLVSHDENQEPMETKKATISNVLPTSDILQQMTSIPTTFQSYFGQYPMSPTPYLLQVSPPMFNPYHPVNMAPFGSSYPTPQTIAHTVYQQQFFGMLPPPQPPTYMFPPQSSLSSTANMMRQQSDTQLQHSLRQQVSTTDDTSQSSLLSHPSSSQDMATDKLFDDMPPLENDASDDSFNSGLNRLGLFATTTDNRTSELSVNNKNIFNDDCDPFGFLK